MIIMISTERGGGGSSFKNGASELKSEAFLRKMTCRLHISDFDVDASKILRLPRKSPADAYKVPQLPRERMSAE